MKAICCYCWVEPAAKGRVACLDCIDRLVMRRVVAKSRRLARQDAGLCVRCVKPTVDGKTSCEKCLLRDKCRRYQRKMFLLCTACNSPVNALNTRCNRCNTIANAASKRSRRDFRRTALRILCGNRKPSCAICGIKRELTVDHIHGDGNLDLLPSGRRRTSSAVYARVINDMKCASWARVLCLPCNLREAKKTKPAKSIKLRVVHKASRGDWGTSVCGSAVQNNWQTSWDLVTCKKCLRSKNRRSVTRR